MPRKTACALALLVTLAINGCCCCYCQPEVTCYSVSNPGEPEGIPYYLPKPLLIVSKNFRYIEDTGEEIGRAHV